MNNHIEDQIVSTSTLEWKPLAEPGIDGTGYPYHNHPGGEELFVVKGSVFINDVLLKAGDYLYTPPGYKHAVRTETGCEVIFIVPEEVEIL